MSSNSTYNVSAGPNTTSPSSYNIVSYDYITAAFKVYDGIEICILTLGIFLNLWFLVAILQSRELRSRLRNKIICNTFVLHLVDSVIVIPFYTVTSLVSSLPTTCFSFSVIHSIQRIQETIINWQLVMIIVVFIAQIQDVNLKSKLNPRMLQAGTWALLIIPWAVSIILVPSLFVEGKNCSFISYRTVQTLRILDTAFPIILAVVLILVAVFLRYRRFNRGHSRSMGTELISRGLEIDGSLAYIVAVVISTACEIINLIDILHSDGIFTGESMGSFVVYVIGLILADVRVILMVLPWLLLPDIRERIKTWRPWYRSGPGIDLTVTYKTETT